MDLIIIGLIFVLLILSGYLLVVTPIRLLPYWLAILFHLLTVAGSILKILHLPGADELLTSIFMGSALSAGLMIWNWVKSSHQNVKISKILLGVCIILQPVFSTLFVVNNSYTLLRIGMYLVFPIILLAAWALVKKETIHRGEQNLIVVILAHAIFAVVAFFHYPYSSFL